jgi:AcrR family transcriptional regulator
MADVKPRRYNSARRQENAEETRRRIIDAARELFMSEGYGGAKIGAIAKKAGVAPQTVYAGFGNKRGILFTILDLMSVDADLEATQTLLDAAAGRPREQMRIRTAFLVRFFAENIEMIDLMRTVSGVEPDLKEVWVEGEARRLRGEAALVAEWEKAGALRPGLSAREATDIWWALSGTDNYRLFVVERGWTRERFLAWLGDTLEHLLFGPQA